LMSFSIVLLHVSAQRLTVHSQLLK
jgi:hypothetical protein